MKRTTKRLLMSGILVVFITACGILPPEMHTQATEDESVSSVPTIEVTEIIEAPTAAPEVTESAELPESQVITMDNVTDLVKKVQLPFENPIAVAWNNASGSFSAYSLKTLNTYDQDTSSALSSTQFDDSAQRLDVSPDGTTLAQTSDMTIIELVDIATNRQVSTINPGIVINSAHFSPDSQRILVTSMDEIIAMEFDLATGYLLDSYTGFEFAGPVYDVTYAQLSDDIIWVSRGSTMVQNLATHKVSEIFHHEDFINSLSLSADGNTLAVATAKTVNGNYGTGIQFWDRNSGQDLGFITTNSMLRGLGFTQDDQLLIGADGNQLCVWNPESMQLIHAFDAHTDLISFVSISPDGREILTGSFDNTIILWAIP